MLKNLSRNQWPEFADAFSREHDGWLISVYLKPSLGKRECIARDVPFHGLTAEMHPGHEAVIISTEGISHTSHVVEDPQWMILTTEEGADARLVVINRSGDETITEFRSPMPVLAVDGIA